MAPRKTRNVKADAGLESVAKAESFAQLISSDGVTFEFQYNPPTIKTSRSAKLAAADVGGTGVQRQQWVNSDGGTMTLSDLLLDGYNLGKSVAPAIEQLNQLLEASAADPADSPDVTFVWGERTFGPAKLSDLSIDESLFLAGKAAQASVSITLVRTAPKDSGAAAAKVTAQAAAVAAAQAVNLTQRQRIDARMAADEFLKANASQLPERLRNAYRAKNFSWRTTTEGVVTVLSGGQPLATVGTWDGFKFTPSSELKN
jgi:hypothetical protein